MSDGTPTVEFLGRPDNNPGVAATGQPMTKNAGLGQAGYDGADRLGKELLTWRPRISTADDTMTPSDKLLLDGRARDVLRNSGPMQGALATHKDSIVGAQYRLNLRPNIKILRLDEVWAEEFQEEVESLFTAWAESEMRWVDTTRTNTFTDLIRLAIGCFFSGGEVLAQMQYLNGRPFSTCVQMIDADRLSNPNDAMDTKFLRRGIERDRFGAPIAAHIRSSHPRDTVMGAQPYKWDRIKFWTGFGRTNILHMIDQQRPEQSRGVSDLASILKESRMGKKFNEISLQNAIVQATYAAAIESELPSQMAFEMIGANDTGDGASFPEQAMAMLSAIAEYTRGGKNIEIDGVKVPHLFPGSKLNMMPAGAAGGVGQDYGAALDRHMSTAIGISYEEYTNDFTKTNYSGYRGAVNKTGKFMRSRKRIVADRMANCILTSWLEEAIVNRRITSMPNNAPDFYEGMNKEAYCQATWIGASAGQVDEMKETQAAIMRIESGISTYEIETSRLGYDFRDIFKQKSREKKMMKALDILPEPGELSPTKPGTLSSKRGKTQPADDKEAAYRAGAIDQDGNDEDGNRPFDDGFGDE